MSAREQFKIGDRVKLSRDGLATFTTRMGKPKTSMRATVIGFSTQSAEHIAVVRDGLKSRERYHMKFWERA